MISSDNLPVCLGLMSKERFMMLGEYEFDTTLLGIFINSENNMSKKNASNAHIKQLRTIVLNLKFIPNTHTHIVSR